MHNTTFNAADLWPWAYVYPPDRIIDAARGLDLTGQAIPPNTPVIRIMPQDRVAKLTPNCSLIASLTPIPISAIAGSGALAAQASVTGP